MRKYPCKKEVNEQVLESKMKEIFGKVARDGKLFSSSYLDSLEVTAEVTGKKEVSVETKSSVGKDQETVIKLYNKFLEDVTGYSSKERKKLMSKT
jgi:Uncharacterized protein conserved in archaea